MVEPFTLSVEDRLIRGLLHLPAVTQPPCVITCHGLFSSKDTEKFCSITSYFTQRGIAVLRFDFGGCGDSSGAIADTTVSRRLRELAAVVQYVKGHPQLSTPLGILGSSLGGFVALVYASQDRSVDALSVWATPFSLHALRSSIPREQIALLKEDFFVDAQKYELAQLLKKINRLIIIHGKQDDVVPWTHAEEILRLAGKPKKRCLIEQGDHALSREEDRQQAIRMSYGWFERHLKNIA